MREQQRITRTRTDAGNHVIGAGSHGFHRFPFRAAVLEELPAGALGQDVWRAPAFVRAVVLLQQIGIGLCTSSEPG